MKNACGTNLKGKYFPGHSKLTRFTVCVLSARSVRFSLLPSFVLAPVPDFIVECLYRVPQRLQDQRIWIPPPPTGCAWLCPSPFHVPLCLQKRILGWEPGVWSGTDLAGRGPRDSPQPLICFWTQPPPPMLAEPFEVTGSTPYLAHPRLRARSVSGSSQYQTLRFFVPVSFLVPLCLGRSKCGETTWKVALL